MAVAAVDLLAMPGTGMAQEGKQDFTLVNKTGYAISEVYVSPTKASDWQEDVMGKDILDDGASVDISFHRNEHPCHWDLKVVYQEDNSTAEWSNFDLCTVSEITIHYNAKTDTTSATYK